MKPDTLLLLSGGLDSAYCMWRALSDGRALRVHHVHLENREGRLHYEAEAVKRILDWMRSQGLDQFVYTESSFGYGDIRKLVRDHCIWAQWIGIIASGEPWIERVIRPDHYDSTPGGPDGFEMRRAERRYRKISWEICERELIWEHPIQHMTKAEVIRAMPRDLIDQCWWCRWPTKSGQRCHKCYTCRLVDAGLEGLVPMFEAKVIHRFRCRLTKRWFNPGDTYRHPSEARMIELATLPVPRIEWPPKVEARIGESEIDNTSDSGGEEGDRPDNAESGIQIDGQGVSPAIEGRPLEELSYRQLQDLAKERGIKAGQSRDALIEALRSFAS